MQALKKVGDYLVALPDSYDPAKEYALSFFVHNNDGFTDEAAKIQATTLWTFLHEERYDHILVVPIGKGLKAWSNARSKADVQFIQKNYKTDAKTRVYIGSGSGAMEPAAQVVFYPWVLQPLPLFFTHNVAIGLFINGIPEFGDYLKAKVQTFLTIGTKDDPKNLERVNSFKTYISGLKVIGVSAEIEIVEGGAEELLYKSAATYRHAFDSFGLKPRDVLNDIMKKIKELPDKNLKNFVGAVDELVALALKYSPN